MTRAPIIVGACLSAVLGLGCGSKPVASSAPASSPATADVAEPTAPHRASSGVRQAVALPDLSGAAASVAAQLRSQHAALTRRINDPTTTAIDLAEAYGEEGMLLMAAEYRDSAEPCLLNAEALAPDDLRWPYYVAHLYRLEGESAKSTGWFERARQIRPDDQATLVWLGHAYLDLGHLDAAQPLFTKVHALYPQSAAGVFGLGRIAFARRDYAAAAQYFEQTLALDPKASIVHYRLAMSYRALGRLEEAEAQLRQKGDHDVGLADPLLDELSGAVHSEFAYEHLGVDALNKRDLAAAIGYFRRGVELAPNDASLRQRLGTALAVAGDGRGAAAEFYEVLRRTPTSATTHYALGVLMVANRRYVEATGQFAAAVNANPSYVEAQLQWADALRRSGRAQESLPHYEQAAMLDPRLADAPLGYAMALASLKRDVEARDRLSESMTRYPDRPAIVHALVRLLAAAADDRVRDGRRAVGIAQDAVAKESPNPDLAEAMAMAMAESGRYADAVTWQRQAMTIAQQLGRVEVSKRLTENLELFERRQPSRQPWRDDDALEVLNAGL